MKSINQIVLVTIWVFIATGLIYSSVSLRIVYAEPPDPCFNNPDCSGYVCSSTESVGSFVSCCWTGPNEVDRICQTCQVDYETGDYVNCSTPHSKGEADSGTVASPPSGNAPPPSTEKCPDNSAIDSKGNCTPITQIPDGSSADDNNKPKLPRGDILGELQSNQGTQAPS